MRHSKITVMVLMLAMTAMLLTGCKEEDNQGDFIEHTEANV